MIKQSHVATLDGLRGLAILLVLGHQGSFAHAIDTSAFLGSKLMLVMDAGWVGVQLFFVLSGFLITGILLDAKGGNIGKTFKHFYLRRSVRIFPIYYVALAVLFAAALFAAPGPEWLENTYKEKWWFIAYLSNWILPFSEEALGHFWSLAVEEQFYMVWPLIVLGVNRRLLVWICAIVIVFAPGFRYFLTVVAPEHSTLTAYMWTPARLDALAIGALLSIVIRSKNWLNKSDGVALGLMLASALYILVVLLTQYRYVPVTSGWPIFNQSVCALFFVGLIYFCLGIKGRSNPLVTLLQFCFSGNAIRSIGKYSYAIYIFHLPVSLLLRAHAYPLVETWFIDRSISGVSLTFAVEAGLLLAVTYGLARLSWIFVEKPFLDLKQRWPMETNERN